MPTQRPVTKNAEMLGRRSPPFGSAARDGLFFCRMLGRRGRTLGRGPLTKHREETRQVVQDLPGVFLGQPTLHSGLKNLERACCEVGAVRVLSHSQSPNEKTLVRRPGKVLTRVSESRSEARLVPLSATKPSEALAPPEVEGARVG